MNYIKTLIAVVIIMVAGYAGYSNAQTDTNRGTTTPNQDIETRANINNEKAMALSKDLRKAWTEHIIWTEKAITAILSDMPGQNEITSRLLENPADMADAVRPYYGEDIASRFENLMREHLTVAADLIKAIRAGEEERARDADARWRANADQIADVLSEANPNWTREEARRMMHEHLDLLRRDVGYRINQNAPEGIANFDRMYEQALEIADAMADKAAQQSPR